MSEKRMVHWLATHPNPLSTATGVDAGQGGWRLHAVEAPKDAKFSELRGRRAACGLLPRHGWGHDLLIEDKCERCLRVNS